MADGNEQEIEYLNDSTETEGYTEREHAFRRLHEDCLVEKLGFKPRGLHLYGVSKAGLRIVERAIRERKERNFVFFPYGAEGTGGLVIGVQQYLGPDAGSISSEEFYERFKKLDEHKRMVIALSNQLDLLAIYGEARKAGVEDVENAVEQLNGAAEVYIDEFSGLLSKYNVRTINDLENIPRALLEPSKIGIDKMQDPLERIMGILREDHLPVLYTAHSINRASRILQSKIKPSQDEMNHAMAVMLYTMIDLETLIKANSGNDNFNFSIGEMLKIAFAVYNHDMGLWVRPSGVTEEQVIQNHPVWGANLYCFLMEKNPEFGLFGDENYKNLILRHHAGINGVSTYKHNGGEVVFNAGNASWDLGDKLAVPGQLLFAYEFLLSRVGGWLMDKKYIQEVDRKAKHAGWKSGKDALGFIAMNWLKEGMESGILVQPMILKQVINTAGIYPRGSDVLMSQKPGPVERHTSRFDYDGYKGRVLDNGMILPTYDGNGEDVYGKPAVDLRKGLGEQVWLKLLRI